MSRQLLDLDAMETGVYGAMLDNCPCRDIDSLFEEIRWLRGVLEQWREIGRARVESQTDHNWDPNTGGYTHRSCKICFGYGNVDAPIEHTRECWVGQMQALLEEK